jgi:phage tail protein X
MDYTTYTVKAGDRWDTIAYIAYGDPLAMYEGVSVTNLIIESNKEIPCDIPLTEGIVLRIPVIDVTQTSEEFLPPWKRTT